MSSTNSNSAKEAKQSPITYIKLEPYLQDYLRELMQIPAGSALHLPKKQEREFFLPYLYHNPTMRRRFVNADGTGGTNAKGYYKDSSSYCQYAVDHVLSTTQPPLIFANEKKPTLQECRKLAPFSLPSYLDRLDMAANSFIEVADRGVALIREWVRTSFYDDLHAYVYGRANYCREHNQKYNITALVEHWMRSNNVHGNQTDFELSVEHIRCAMYRHTPTYEDFDSDTIIRSLRAEVAQSHLPSDVNAKKSLK